MPFLLLLVLTLICLQHDWPEASWLGVAGSEIVTWGGVALFVVAAYVLARGLRAQLLRDPDQRSTLLRRYATCRRYHTLALLIFYLAAVCLLGWGWTARSLLTPEGLGSGGPAAASGATLPGAELLTLAPFLAALIFSWACFYDIERAVHATATFQPPPFPGRWSYVGLQARHNLLLVAPPLLLLLVQQSVLAIFPGLQQDELFLPLFLAGLLAAVFISIPWLLRLLLGLTPLPPGPLRDRLLATAQRLNFRFTDILVWDTRNTTANAMVTGPLRWLRYVVLTDRLILEMTEDEVEAVFGHEIGHIKHHHMLFYFAFLMASLVLLVGAWTTATKLVGQESVQNFLRANVPTLMAWIDSYKVLGVLPLLVLLGVYMFVVFGFLSRRCERQADMFGCRTASVEVFISALEKVALLNGISRDQPGWLSSWQHSTIALRVEFLQRLSADPELEPRMHRRVGLVKWGMVLSVWGMVLSLGAALLVLNPRLLKEILELM